MNSIEFELDKLDREYNINSGGCCFVAYLLARELEKRHIRFKLRIYDYCLEGKKLEIRKAIKNRTYYDDYSSCNHYALLIGEEVINVADYVDGDRCIDLGCINSSDIKYLYDKGRWNKTYKPGDNKEVESLIKQICNDNW